MEIASRQHSGALIFGKYVHPCHKHNFNYFRLLSGFQIPQWWTKNPT